MSHDIRLKPDLRHVLHGVIPRSRCPSTPRGRWYGMHCARNWT